MIIVEYWTDGPILKTALNHDPDITIRLEEHYVQDGAVRYIFWAEGGDLSAFETGLANDSTVSSTRTLAESSTSRLYRVTVAEQAMELAMLPTVRDLDLVPLEIEASCDGWTVRMRCPDRETLAEYRRQHLDQGTPFTVRSIYHQSNEQHKIGSILTDPQYEALVTAYEKGHFSVPQRATQTDIATELGITPQSVSERLHRGIETLIETTLLPR